MHSVPTLHTKASYFIRRVFQTVQHALREEADAWVGRINGVCVVLANSINTPLEQGLSEHGYLLGAAHPAPDDQPALFVKGGLCFDPSSPIARSSEVWLAQKWKLLTSLSHSPIIWGSLRFTVMNLLTDCYKWVTLPPSLPPSLLPSQTIHSTTPAQPTAILPECNIQSWWSGIQPLWSSNILPGKAPW